MNGITLPHDVSSPSPERTGTGVRWAVAAHGTTQAAGDALTALRRKPGPGLGTTLPANFLKHADEQTVVGVSAVLKAIHAFQLDVRTFTDWGVLGAPRFLGRQAMAVSLKKYAAEGAWGVSPHLVPNLTLHSLSGTISLALKIHGPNFGVGGGPDSESEGLLTAATLLEGRQLPGVWLVLSGWDPEPIPDPERPGPPASVCAAVALALTSAATPAPGGHLSLHPCTPSTDAPACPFHLPSLLAALAAPAPVRQSWCLSTGWRVEYEPSQLGRENES